MDVVPIFGNLQTLEKAAPKLPAASSIGGVVGTGTDFAVTLRQSRESMATTGKAGKDDKGFSAVKRNLPGEGKKSSSRLKVENGENDHGSSVNGPADNHFRNGKAHQSGSRVKSKDVESHVASMTEASGDDAADHPVAEERPAMVETPQKMALSLLQLPAAATVESLDQDRAMTAGMKMDATQVLVEKGAPREMLQPVQPFPDSGEMLLASLVDEPGSSLLGKEAAGENNAGMVMRDLTVAVPSGLGEEVPGFQALSGENGTLTAGIDSQVQETSEIPFPAMDGKRNQGQRLDGMQPPELLASGSNENAVLSAELNLPGEAVEAEVLGAQLTASGAEPIDNDPAVGAEKAAGMILDSDSLNQPKRSNVKNGATLPIVQEVRELAVKIRSAQDLAGRHLEGQKSPQVPVPAAAGEHSAASDKDVLFSGMLEKAGITAVSGREQFVAAAQGMEQAASGAEKSLPVTSNDILNQVTMQVADRHDRRQVVTIQLQPESLGKVEVKLVMEHQKLTAHFMVQHSEVRDVLLKHVTSLHDALAAKGVDVKQVAVEIAPPEKTAGMAVTVDHHSAGGDQAGGFQPFAGGEGRHRHAFTARDQASGRLFETEEATSLTGLTEAELLRPGSLHIRA